MERYELPDGWEWSTLGDVCSKPQYGYTTKASPKKSGPKFLRITDLKEDGVNWDTVPYCAEPPENKDNFLLHDDDLVVARAGSVGKSYIVINPPEAIFASYLIRFRPIKALSSYLAYFLHSPHYWRQIEDTSTGTTMFNVNATKLAALDVPLAPPDEQPRIVAKIESLFEQSRSARTALVRVPALMLQFRRAVLASAFRGELVEPDPNDEPAASLLERVNESRKSIGSKKLAHSDVVDTDNLPEIPGNWVWTTLEVLAEIRNGVTKGRDLGKFETIEIPYLRVANVQDGYLDLREMKTIQVKRTEIEKVRLRPYDILFNEGGDRDKLGRGTVWRGEIDVCTHQNHVHCARLYLQDVFPDWVSLASQLSYARDYFFSAASQTVNLASLNSTQLKGLPVPLPPVNEQKRILEKVKALLTQANTIEQAASVSLRRAEQVDQSILARAFRGELVR